MNEQIKKIIDNCVTEQQLQTCLNWVDMLFAYSTFDITLALDAIDQRREHLQALYNTVHIAD